MIEVIFFLPPLYGEQVGEGGGGQKGMNERWWGGTDQKLEEMEGRLVSVIQSSLFQLKLELEVKEQKEWW